MPTFETPVPITVTVDLPVGELRVVASDRTDTTVTVDSAAQDRDRAEAIHVELAAGELRVTGPAVGLLQKIATRTPGTSIEVEIALPTGSALSIRSGFGGVEARGRFGACSVDARYGDVRVEDAGSVSLTVGYGRAEVTGTVAGDAKVTSDHGGVHLGRVTGAATLRSKHGGVRVGTIGGEAHLVGAHGAIEVDVVEAGATVRNPYGGSRLGRVSRGEIDLVSSYGAIEVGIAEGSVAWLDLDTRGRVSNDLEPRDDPSGSAETVTVHAVSGDGTIAVRRARPTTEEPPRVP